VWWSSAVRATGERRSREIRPRKKVSRREPHTAGTTILTPRIELNLSERNLDGERGIRTLDRG
jgi:hypothetical protein